MLRTEMETLRPAAFNTFQGGVQKFDTPENQHFNIGHTVLGADPTIRNGPDGYPTFAAEYMWDRKSPFIFEFQGVKPVRIIEDPEESHLPAHGYIVGTLDLDRHRWDINISSGDIERGSLYQASSGGAQYQDTVSFPNHFGQTVKIMRLYHGPRAPVLSEVQRDRGHGTTGGQRIPMPAIFNAPHRVDNEPFHEQMYGHIRPLNPNQPSSYHSKQGGRGRIPHNDYMHSSDPKYWGLDDWVN